MGFSITGIKSTFREQFSLKNNSPEKLSFTMAFGVFMGIVPFWGFQMLIAFALAAVLKLNKPLVIIAANISLPPIIPFILLGSYWIGGITMGIPGGGPLISNLNNFSDIEFNDFFENIGNDLFQYVIGAFILASILGVITYGITYGVLLVRKRFV